MDVEREGGGQEGTCEVRGGNIRFFWKGLLRLVSGALEEGLIVRRVCFRGRR